MITILDLAESRGIEHTGTGGITEDAFNKVGLTIFGGCDVCHASIAAYNAYPSRSGFWKCADCIDLKEDAGFETAAEYEAWQLTVVKEELR